MANQFGFDLELAPSVLLVFDAALVPACSTTRVQRKALHPFRQVGSLHDGVDIVLAAGPGAPVAAITVEFLAHFGARTIVSVGTAGRLSEQDSESTTVHNVVASAVSDEGTSGHYSTDLTADRALTAALAEIAGVAPCTTLTTDAPFRHTPARLNQHRQHAQVTEMECAALFAASHHFDVRTAALLTTSDEFADEGWRPLNRRVVNDALHEAVAIGTQVLRNAP